MPVRIVTDSTSDLPEDVAGRLGVTVVPQNVHFGTRTWQDNVTITPDEFYSMLARSPELPTTSQASPGQFRGIYDMLGRAADGIVSIHISSRISGTYNSALQGAAVTSAACPVEIVDSAQGSMGLGLVVIAAAAASNRGAGHDEVVALARDAASRAQCFTLFETLEYLRKGGRIGKAQGPARLCTENQADGHSEGWRGTSAEQGPYVPLGPDQPEADRARLCPGRVPGGDAQHYPRNRG